MAESFAEYLTRYRALVVTGFGGADSPTDAQVLALTQAEYIKQHEAAVVYEYIGDDSNGYPVYRLGTAIVLVDIKTNLDALVTAHSLHVVPGSSGGLKKAAYSANPSLRMS